MKQSLNGRLCNWELEWLRAASYLQCHLEIDWSVFVSVARCNNVQQALPAEQRRCFHGCFEYLDSLELINFFLVNGCYWDQNWTPFHVFVWAIYQAYVLDISFQKSWIAWEVSHNVITCSMNTVGGHYAQDYSLKWVVVWKQSFPDCKDVLQFWNLIYVFMYRPELLEKD